MKKILCLLVPVCLFSCVSKSDYTKLENDYTKLKTDYEELKTDYEKEKRDYEWLNNEFKSVLEDNKQLKERYVWGKPL